MKWNWNKIRKNIQDSSLSDLYTLSDIVKNELKKRDKVINWSKKKIMRYCVELGWFVIDWNYFGIDEINKKP